MSRSRMLVVLGVLAVVIFISARVYHAPPAPRSVDAPATEFSAGRAWVTLKELLGDEKPHPLGTAEAARVRQDVIASLQKLGYQVDSESGFACGPDPACGTVRNVVAYRPEDRNDTHVVLVAAHYDSVPAGPGVADDGSGVAAALEIARAVRREHHRHGIVFLIDDGEEMGLLGAQSFMQQSPWRQRLGAVVNMEARGTGGASFMFETRRDNAWIAALMARDLPHPATGSLFYSIYQRLPNDTDYTVFKAHDVPGVNFAFIDHVARYHTPRDDMAHLSQASLQHQGEHALAMARALADSDLEAPPKGDAVWFDWLSLGLVHWPLGWSLWIALLGLALTLGAVVSVVRSGQLEAGRVAAAWGWWLVVVLAVALVEVAFGRLLAWRFPGLAWLAHGLPVEAAAWLLAGGVAWGIYAALLRQVSSGALYFGAALWLALLGVVLAVGLPEVSYLLCVPALAAGVGAWLLRRSPTVTAVVVVLVGGTILLPVAAVLYSAMGLPMLAAIGVLVAMALTPVFALTSAASRRWMPIVLVLLGLLSGAVGLSLPGANADHPRHLNLLALNDASGARLLAPWTALPSVPALEAATSWSKQAETPFPWAPTARFAVAPSAGRALPGPVFTDVERHVENGWAVIHGRIVSPRKARVCDLHLAPASAIRMLTFDGVEVPLERVRRRRSGDDWLSARYQTVPPDGLRFAVVVAPQATIHAAAVDWSPGVSPADEKVEKARPPEVVPVHRGDATLAVTRTDWQASPG